MVENCNLMNIDIKARLIQCSSGVEHISIGRSQFLRFLNSTLCYEDINCKKT